MPQKSAPELFAVVHYLHRLSTEGKRGAKMALESCPKCHFIMLEGVLMTIEEHGQNGSIYVSDLAAAVKQPLPAVSRALRQLEQDGLIERITDPNDRRKTLVRPTEKGLDASRQVETAISRYFERVICRIPGRATGTAVFPDRYTAGGCGSGKCGATSKIEGRNENG
mgnify:CR=1 FL=1